MMRQYRTAGGVASFRMQGEWMRESGTKSKPGILGKILALAAAAVIMVVLQGCSSSVSANPNATLEAIKITPSASLILLGGARQLIATGVYSNGISQDITQQVTWGASSAPSTTNYVSVSSTGVATGMAIGASIITATLGDVVGVIALTVNTNGYSSGTTTILTVPYKGTETDAAYLPEPLTQIQGAYAVQEVNLDADQFSSVLPVPVALLASIPMPAGFVPNATAGSQTSSRVAVISYTSPEVQVIDASNEPTDTTNNTVISTFTAPVTGSVTFNGVSCIICAAVVNPANDQLLLSTAQGYYSMDLTTGAFTALPLAPTAFPAPNFALNPTATQPYILSPTFGQDPKLPGEIQVLNLATNSVATLTNSGLPNPGAAAIDLVTGYAAVVDANVNDQNAIDLTDLQSPSLSLVTNVSVCNGQPDRLNMVALGVSANPVISETVNTLFTSQTLGNCIGLELWPSIPPLNIGQILYGYGSLPATPDGNGFVTSEDPNAIATFTSIVDKKNYGVLVDGGEMNGGGNWIAKINFATVFSLANIGPGNGNPPLPGGQVLTPLDLAAGVGGDPVLYLPTPNSAVTLSLATIGFGSLSVGTSTPLVPVTLTYIGTNATTFLDISNIAIQGPNAADFTETNTCGSNLSAQSTCVINVTFTPSATGQRSAVLSVTDNGGASPQTVTLSGTGT